MKVTSFSTYKNRDMTRDEVRDIVIELGKDGPIGDDDAFAIADGVLFDNPGMEEAIKEFFAPDAIGWLADRI